nr:CoA-binding protein [Candidatus Sigynarchaeota archaeon]
MNKNIEYFRPLFYPKTMAVIGASNNPVGAVKYVKGHKDVMKVYPVNSNPKLVELEGLPVYRSIKDVPEESIDLAIIGVPKEFVPGVIDEFKQKEVKFAVIFTSGFEESGNTALAEQLRKSIKGVSTRFIGPNCLGVYNPRGNLVYFPNFPKGNEVAGSVSYISQSGGHTAKLNTFLMARGVFFSKTISIGNAIDLQPHDFFSYFKEDPDTRVLGLYLESTPDGRGLMNALKEITPVKPVVIWKGGQGSVGMHATATHTGKLAGDYMLFKAMAEQSGAIVPDDFDSFADTLTALGFGIPLPRSKRVAVIGCGGGNAVEAADIFESFGFDLPELHVDTRKRINEFIPEINSALRNP